MSIARRGHCRGAAAALGFDRREPNHSDLGAVASGHEVVENGLGAERFRADPGGGSLALRGAEKHQTNLTPKKA